MPGRGLFGRDGELAELAVLVDPGHLVTLTGPGGVGKTTLAEELTAEAESVRRVVWVHLGGVERTEDVESRFASAMGQANFDLISNSTFEDGGLVVVDNCEHVLDAAARAIATLHALLPGLSILATSRSPLGLRNEVVVPVAPLAVPPPGTIDPDAPAVEMFRSVAQRAGGQIDSTDLGAVCELVRRVDGVPLAVEIVATRTRSMSVGEILERLGDRLDSIGQGGFRRDSRQRSVRDTVEWSYHLLDLEDRQLFDRLGVHAGGSSTATAHALTGCAEALDSVLDRLDRLVAASLLVPTRSHDGSTWYHQLHAVRACALDHLDASGERAAVTERFVDHMVAEADALAEGAKDGGTARAVTTMVMLLDGFLFAVRWAIEHDETPERALRIMPVLWGHQSRTDDVLEASRRVIERWPDDTHPGWADAAAIVATCLVIDKDLDAAAAMVERAAPVEKHALWAPVMLRRARGLVEWAQGDRRRALSTFVETEESARRLGLAWFSTDAKLLQASLLIELGDREAALRITREVRALGPEQVLATAIATAVESDALLDDDVPTSIEIAREGREIAESTGYVAADVALIRTLAIARALEGETVAAATELLEGLRLNRAGGTPTQSPVLEAAAVIAHRTGHPSWSSLARAAAACPPVPMLQSATRFLPEWPPQTDGGLGLVEAVSLADGILTELSGSTDSASTSTASSDATGDVPHRPSDPPDDHHWTRTGDHWEIEFDGRSVIVADGKGLHDLAMLIRTPGVEIAAIDLMGTQVTSDDTGEVIDARARRQYEDRIRELQDDLAEAEDDNDIGRAERVSSELDALVEHLTRAVGLGGKSRRSGGTSERARTAVTRRIRKAIAHLLDLHPALGRHLDASIRTGTYCEYRPERPTQWRVTR